jgi:hypothetical protein
MAFASFMSSAAGRILRVVAGLIIVAVGVYLSLTGSVTAGVIVAIVGLVPFLAGVFDVCVFAPLLGAPFSGAKVRTHAHS